MSITEALEAVRSLIELITTDEDIRQYPELNDALTEADGAVAVIESYVAKHEGQGGLGL